MRTEERLRQAQRADDYQAEVKALMQGGFYIKACKLLMEKQIHDVWDNNNRMLDREGAHKS